MKPAPSRSRSALPIEPRRQLPQLRGLLLHLASERGLATNSLHAYRRDLEDVDAFLRARARDLDSADADDYREYLQSQTRRGQSTRTVARRLAAIRSWLVFAQINGRPTRAILDQLERPKPERSLPKVLSRSQVVDLISAPDPEAMLFVRDVAILELLYSSGLRASELCDVKLRDVNFQVGCVRVMGKGSKERIVPLGRAAIEAIGRYLNECRPKLEKKPQEKLFLTRTGRPMERVGLWMLVDKAARRRGMLKRVGPHTLRHCFATHLLGGGADLRVVQELLGHSDIGTTQIYTHVDGDRLKSVHRKYHPRG